MMNGAVWRKEGQPLLLKASKTFLRCVVWVCKPSIAMYQHGTYHTTPNACHSIFRRFGCRSSQVGSSRGGKHCRVMYERATIAAEGFQKLSQMCVPSLQALFCNEPTRNPSQPTQTLPVKLPTIWPEPAKRGPRCDGWE